MNTANHLRNILIANSIADRTGNRLQSVSAEDLKDARPDYDYTLERLENTLRKMPAEEVFDRDEFSRALRIFLGKVDRTFKKLGDEPGAYLTKDETSLLEAVIRTDGSRPSLLLHGGRPDPDHPMAGSWRDLLFANRQKIGECAAAIGRVEPDNPSARNFFGTCWLVKKLSDDEGLVLTNLHVLQAMQRRLSNAILPAADGSFVFLDGAWVEFIAEAGTLKSMRWKVTAARSSNMTGAGFQLLDAAVLTIRRTGNEGFELPTPLGVIADLDAPLGNTPSFIVIGFPGVPAFTSGVRDGVDWAWVNGTLFGNRFGVKRVAPGYSHKTLGSIPGDPRKWVFGHDATTLGGSSGSPVIDWLNDPPGSVGLHFAGTSVDTNFAHAVAQCRAELEQLGIPILERNRY